MTSESEAVETGDGDDAGAAPSIIWKDRSTTALKALAHSVIGDTPMVVLTGEAGSGRTTYLATLTRHLPDTFEVFDIAVGDGSVETLMSDVSSRLDLGLVGPEPEVFQNALRKKLFDEDSSGRRIVLMVDNADELSGVALQTLVDMATINRKDRHLIRIVLTGTSEVFDRLKGADVPEGVALIDAISVPNLTRTTASELIKREIMRLSEGARAIEDPACAAIYRETNGVPGPTKALVERIDKEAARIRIDTINIRNIRDLMLGADAKRPTGPVPVPNPAPTGQTPAPANPNANRPAPSAPPTELPRSAPRPVPAPAPPPSAQATQPPQQTPGTRPIEDLVGKPDALPQSIRESQDPQQLLRWAMGIRKEKEAPQDAAATAPAPVETAKAPPPDAAAETPPPEPETPGQAQSRGLAASEQFEFQAEPEIVAERGYKPSQLKAEHAEPPPFVTAAATADAPPQPVRERRRAPAFLGGVALGALLAAGTWAAATLFGDGLGGAGNDNLAPPDPVMSLADPQSVQVAGFGQYPELTPRLSVPNMSAARPIGRMAQPALTPADALSASENRATRAIVDAETRLLDAQREFETVRQEADAAEEIASTREQLSAEVAEATRLRESLATQNEELTQQNQDAAENLAAATAELRTARQTLAERSAELESLREQLRNNEIAARNVEETTSQAEATARERLATLNAEASGLESTLAGTRALLNTLTADVDASRAQLGELDEILSARRTETAEAQTRYNETENQRQLAEERLARVNAELEAENTALADTLERAGVARDELGRLQEQIAQARAATEEAGAEIEAAEAHVLDLQAEITALNDQKTQAEADARTAAEAADAEIEASEARILELQNEITALNDRKAGIEAEAETASTGAAQIDARLESLDTELATLSDELAARAIQAEAARDNLANIVDQADNARAVLQATQDDLLSRRADLAEIERQIELALAGAPDGAVITPPELRGDGERDTTASLEAGVAVLNPPQTRDIDEARAALDAEPAVQPRDPAIVAAALEKAPGLGGLSPSARADLETRIAGGACLTDALQEATGQINRHTLAILLRTLTLCSN